MPRSESSSSRRVWMASELSENPHEIPDKADRVQRMFAAIAHRYDLNNRLHSFGRDQAWRRAVVRLADVGSGDEVLDVACGTGDLTEAFARVRPAGVTGLDFTAAMLDLARDKARRLPGDCPEPAYVQGDAEHLPFDDRRFDIASIAFGIRNVSDPAGAIAEFRRVLRPGGRLLILEFSEPPNPVLRAFNRLYTRRIMPVTATLLARDRSGAYRYLPRSVSTFLDPPKLAEMLEDAGFEKIEQRPQTFGVCTITVGRVPTD